MAPWNRVRVLRTTPVEPSHDECMTGTRTTTAAGLLVIEAGLAVLGVLFHYGFTAEYGDVTVSALEGLRWGFSTGIGGVALGIVGVAALVSMLVSSGPWMRLVALAIPVLMVLGMLAVTPVALREKLEVQYDSTPQCVSDEGPGPGSRAELESQQAFDSIEHVGHFGGGGGSGVGGCDRSFVLTQDFDVLQRYRVALPEAGWRGWRVGWRVAGDRMTRTTFGRSDMARPSRSSRAVGVAWCGPAGMAPTVECGATSSRGTERQECSRSLLACGQGPPRNQAVPAPTDGVTDLG